LMKKSKQPKSVTRNHIGMDLSNDFASEHISRDKFYKTFFP
jgi:hypothetical protein